VDEDDGLTWPELMPTQKEQREAAELTDEVDTRKALAAPAGKVDEWPELGTGHAPTQHAILDMERVVAALQNEQAEAMQRFQNGFAKMQLADHITNQRPHIGERSPPVWVGSPLGTMRSRVPNRRPSHAGPLEDSRDPAPGIDGIAHATPNLREVHRSPRTVATLPTKSHPPSIRNMRSLHSINTIRTMAATEEQEYDA